MRSLSALSLLARATRPVLSRIHSLFAPRRRSIERCIRASIEPLEPRQLLDAITLNGDDGPNAWYIRRSPSDSANVQVFNHSTPTGDPVYEGARRTLDSLVLNGGAGNDRITIDFSLGVPIRDGILTFNAGSGTDDSITFIGHSAFSATYNPTSFGSGTASIYRKSMSFSGVDSVSFQDLRSFSVVTSNPADRLTIDSPESGQTRIRSTDTGNPTIAPATFWGTNKITLDTSGANGSGHDEIILENTGLSSAATLIVSTGTAATGQNNTLVVNGGNTNFHAGWGASGGRLAVTVNNSAVLNLAATQYISSLTLNDSSRVNLPTGRFKIAIVDSLTIASTTATLDVGDNDLILHNGSVSTITSLIQRGRGSGNWQGTGITSSAAAAAPSLLSALGVINNRVSPIDGQTLVGTDIIVKFVYGGDANLDNIINFDDYFRINTGYLGGLSGWFNGDFNYSGVVNFDDYFIINNAFGYQGAYPPPPFTVTGDASTPEGADYGLTLHADTLMSAGYWDESDPEYPVWIDPVYYDPISYWTVYWGDGEYETVPGDSSGTVTPTHAYADDSAAYTISTFAKGSVVNYFVGTKSVTVSEVAPTLTVSGDDHAPEGQAYTLTLSASDPGDDAISSWHVDWGDGTAAETYQGDIESVQHTFYSPTNGIAVTAADEDGSYQSSVPSVDFQPATSAWYYALDMFLPGWWVTQGRDSHMQITDGVELTPPPYDYYESSYAVLASSPANTVGSAVSGYTNITDYSGNYTITMPNDFNAASGPQVIADVPEANYHPTGQYYTGEMRFRPGPTDDWDGGWTLNVYPMVLSLFAVDTAGEGLTPGDPAGFRISRNWRTQGTMDVTFDLGGSADYGVDYTLTGVASVVGNRVTVTFQPEQYEAFVGVNVMDDSILEWTESIEASLNAGPYMRDVNYHGGTVQITDNETADLVLNSMSEAVEDDPGLVVPVDDDGSEDRIPLELHVPQDIKDGAYIVLSVNNPDKVKVFSAGKQIIGPGDDSETWPAGSAPTSVEVQAFGVSDAFLDIAFTLLAQDAGTRPSTTQDSSRQTNVKVGYVTVLSGATRSNLEGDKNWAAVKKPTEDVVVQATLRPAVPQEKIPSGLVVWQGGSAVPGTELQRKVSKAVSAKTTVKATVGKSSDYVDVWIVWTDLVVNINGTIAADNGATELINHNFPDELGGGNGLGPIDHDTTPILEYAYAVGRVQAKATITPPGFWLILNGDRWQMKREAVRTKAWDNGGHYRPDGSWVAEPSVTGVNEDDTSKPNFVDLDPAPNGILYDLDGPAASMRAGGIVIKHTSEAYVDFRQYVTVKLDAVEEQCSDDVYWSYQAQVDADKTANRVEMNTLALSCYEAFPNEPHYRPRWSIGGRVTDGGNGLGGVTITAGGKTTTTAADGTYTLLNVEVGQVVVTPSKANYTFTDPTQTLTLSDRNVFDINFTASRQ